VDGGIAAGTVCAAIRSCKNSHRAGLDCARVLYIDADIAAVAVRIALGDGVDAVKRIDAAGVLNGHTGVAAGADGVTERAGHDASAHCCKVARIVDSNADIAVIADGIAERCGVDRAGVDHTVGQDGAAIDDRDRAVIAIARGIEDRRKIGAAARDKSVDSGLGKNAGTASQAAFVEDTDGAVVSGRRDDNRGEATLNRPLIDVATGVGESQREVRATMP
jgi:hypothetical protein